MDRGRGKVGAATEVHGRGRQPRARARPWGTLASGPVEQVLSDPNVIRAYLGGAA